MLENKLFAKCEKLFLAYLIHDNMITLDDVHDWVYAQYGHDDTLDLFFDKNITAISLREVSDIFDFSFNNTDIEHCEAEYELGKLAYMHRDATDKDLHSIANRILYRLYNACSLFSDSEIKYLYNCDDSCIQDEESIAFLRAVLHKYSNLFEDKYKLFSSKSF
jgi:hypothetical protein